MFQRAQVNSRPARATNIALSVPPRFHLLEGVRAGAPVGEEQRKTNGLEDAGEGSNGDGVKRSLLSENLGNELCAKWVSRSSQQLDDEDVPMGQSWRRRSSYQGRRRPCS